jgi:glycosyltransferase involved in cell wall biosynthesis
MNTHVCHIATMTQWGGVERILVDFLANVGQSEFSHVLLTTSSSIGITRPIKRAGIEIFQPVRHFHYDPGAVLQMAGWLRSNNTQIVHAYNAVSNAWGNLAALLARVPVYIAGEHGSIWRIRSTMYWLNRLAYHRAQCVIANSEASKLLVCKKYHIHPSKVRVVYNIIAPPRQIDRERVRKELGIGTELLVGSVGRLHQQKAYNIFIDAAKIVTQLRSDIKFILVGGGEQMNFLTKKIQKLDMEERFFLTGWRDDARELLSGFDIFVSTSIYEPFGNVLIEAALAGVPVIAPRVDGIPEAVQHGITGKLISPQHIVKEKSLPSHVVIDGGLSDPREIEPAELAQSILEFAANPEMRRQYGKAGQQRAKNFCTVEKYITDIESIYTKLIDIKE